MEAIITNPPHPRALRSLALASHQTMAKQGHRILYLFIYLLMAVLGLRFCVRAFSSCGKWGPLFIAVCGPLTIAASLVVEHRLQTLRLSNCGSRAQLLRGMWDLPRPGLEPVSPALAGRFSTSAPPGKPNHRILLLHLEGALSWPPVSLLCLGYWPQPCLPTTAQSTSARTTRGQRNGGAPARGAGTAFLSSVPEAPSKSSGPDFELT